MNDLRKHSKSKKRNIDAVIQELSAGLKEIGEPLPPDWAIKKQILEALEFYQTFLRVKRIGSLEAALKRLDAVTIDLPDLSAEVITAYALALTLLLLEHSLAPDKRRSSMDRALKIFSTAVDRMQTRKAWAELGRLYQAQNRGDTDNHPKLMEWLSGQIKDRLIGKAEKPATTITAREIDQPHSFVIEPRESPVRLSLQTPTTLSLTFSPDRPLSVIDLQHQIIPVLNDLNEVNRIIGLALYGEIQSPLIIASISYHSPFDLSLLGWIPEALKLLMEWSKQRRWKDAYEKRLAQVDLQKKEEEVRGLQLQNDAAFIENVQKVIELTTSTRLDSEKISSLATQLSPILKRLPLLTAEDQPPKLES